MKDPEFFCLRTRPKGNKDLVAAASSLHEAHSSATISMRDENCQLNLDNRSRIRRRTVKSKL